MNDAQTFQQFLRTEVTQADVLSVVINLALFGHCPTVPTTGMGPTILERLALSVVHRRRFASVGLSW